MAQLSTNLIVRGESVQALYAQFRAGNLVVNRRYQRKLVWSIEEKISFVDSLQRQLPVPLILVAERSSGNITRLEIIDGLQRLDAVFGFINNSFGTSAGHFDLATLAESKVALDSGELTQKTPILPREACISFAGYSLPLSVYRAATDDEVDEIFRRINSGGRHLSQQDLRQAGSTSRFASIVRDLAAQVRGDVSISDIVDLRDMPKISISSRKDAPGVFIEDIVWVKNNILEREQVRESRDEEVIADLLVSTSLDPMPAYDSRILDEVYGLREDTGRSKRMDAVLLRDTPEVIKEQFMSVMSTFLEIFDTKENGFSSVLFDSPKQRVPRYFEAVFLGLTLLIIDEKLELFDVVGARKALKGVGNKHIDIPSGGGTWTASSKKKNADVVAGLLRNCMREAKPSANPALERNALLLENLLRASMVESSLMEFKQGLSELASPPKLSEKIVQEIAKTLAAMANHGSDTTGFLVVGIADKVADASRVSQLTGKPTAKIEGRFVTGLEIDIGQKKGLDDLVMWFTQKFQAIDMPESLRSQVLRDMRAVSVAERLVLLLKVKSQNEPVAIENKFFERQGSQTIEVPGGQVGRLFARFR